MLFDIRNIHDEPDYSFDYTEAMQGLFHLTFATVATAIRGTVLRPLLNELSDMSGQFGLLHAFDMMPNDSSLAQAGSNNWQVEHLALSPSHRKLYFNSTE